MSDTQRAELIDKLNGLSDTELTYVVGMAEGMILSKSAGKGSGDAE